MSQPQRARGRPRGYDPKQALARALDTFWHGGFAATSLDDLAEAMQMQRPSVYAAFGDKQRLYQAALESYAADSCKALLHALEAPTPLRQSLRTLYRGAIEFYLRGDAARGCFLVGTAVTEARSSRPIRQLLERTFERFTALFEQRFQLGALSGELSEAADPSGLAHVATATLNTLSLRARTGASRPTLEALAAATVDIICARPARSTAPKRAGKPRRRLQRPARNDRAR
jgi:AcrR family transcriptional regulator